MRPAGPAHDVIYPARQRWAVVDRPVCADALFSQNPESRVGGGGGTAVQTVVHQCGSEAFGEPDPPLATPAPPSPRRWPGGRCCRRSGWAGRPWEWRPLWECPDCTLASTFPAMCSAACWWGFSAAGRAAACTGCGKNGDRGSGRLAPPVAPPDNQFWPISAGDFSVCFGEKENEKPRSPLCIKGCGAFLLVLCWQKDAPIPALRRGGLWKKKIDKAEEILDGRRLTVFILYARMRLLRFQRKHWGQDWTGENTSSPPWPYRSPD